MREGSEGWCGIKIRLFIAAACITKPSEFKMAVHSCQSSCSLRSHSKKMVDLRSIGPIEQAQYCHFPSWNSISANQNAPGERHFKTRQVATDHDGLRHSSTYDVTTHWQ